MKIAGREVPNWAIGAGAVGLLALLVARGNGGGTANIPPGWMIWGPGGGGGGGGSGGGGGGGGQPMPPPPPGGNCDCCTNPLLDCPCPAGCNPCGTSGPGCGGGGGGSGHCECCTNPRLGCPCPPGCGGGGGGGEPPPLPDICRVCCIDPLFCPPVPCGSGPWPCSQHHSETPGGGTIYGSSPDEFHSSVLRGYAQLPRWIQRPMTKEPQTVQMQPQSVPARAAAPSQPTAGAGGWRETVMRFIRPAQVKS
jgi:hypothetical protein